VNFLGAVAAIIFTGRGNKLTNIKTHKENKQKYYKQLKHYPVTNKKTVKNTSLKNESNA